MLVLTRKLNEAVNLGDSIKISILSIENDRVRIGIEAPADMRIIRSELLDEIKNINKEAINTDIVIFSKEN